MAEESKATPPAKSSSKSSGPSGNETGNTLAPVAGSYEEARPADETPGDPAHLGSERPYEGGPSPFVEGEA